MIPNLISYLKLSPLTSIFFLLFCTLHCAHVSGTTLAGVTRTSPPFVSTEGNRFTGYCVDVLKEIKARTGLNYSLYLVADNQYGPGPVHFGGGLKGMIGDVVSQKADFAIGDMTVTSLRQRYVNFTLPIFTFSISALVRKELVKNYRTLDDLAIKSNLTIGAYPGGNTMKNMDKVREVRTVRWLMNQIEKNTDNYLLKDRETIMRRIKSGHFAFIQEEPVSLYEAASDCTLTVLPDPNYYINGRYGIAFRPDSPYLRLFNRAIAQMTSDGTLDALRRRHFNVGCLKNGGATVVPSKWTFIGQLSLFTTLLLTSKIAKI